MKDHSQSCGAVKCQECNLNFQGKSDLDTHIKTHHEKTCPLCTVSCKNNEVLTEHIKEKHAVTYYCNICEQDFDSKTNLVEHMSKEHVSECNVYGVKFKTYTELKKHLEGCKIFPCNECNECNDIYYEQWHLEEHRTEQHKNKCTRCEQTFSTHSDLVEL